MNSTSEQDTATLSDVPGHLTDYERAVCYYSLPHTNHPVTIALVAVYVLCVIEAIAALVYGVLSGNEAWQTAGTYALMGIILFGVAAFLVRGFINDYRERRLLRRAHQLPESDTAHRPDVPDPFENHVLLSYGLAARRDQFNIVDGSGEACYRVYPSKGGRRYSVLRLEDEDAFTVTLHGHGLSFLLGGPKASRVVVAREEQTLATVRPRFRIRGLFIDILDESETSIGLVVRDNAVFQGDIEVGRVYIVNARAYLDIEGDSLHYGVLGLFIAMV